MGFSDSTCYLLNKGFELVEQVKPVYEGKIVPKGTPDSSVKWEFGGANIEWTFYSGLIDLKGRKMLDVGCGYGGKTAFYATKGADVTGIDMRPHKLARARLFAREKGVEGKTLFLCADAAALPFGANTFDLVMSNNVIPYLTNPLESLREWKRVVKPRGLICVNFGPPWLAPNGAPDIGRCFPWTHLLFSETAIRKAFARMKRGLPDHNGSIYGHMNRINIRRFRQLLVQLDLDLLYFKLWTRRYAAPLIRMPFELLAKVILNGVKNLGWGITWYLVDPPPQTLRFAQGDIIGAFCKRLFHEGVFFGTGNQHTHKKANGGMKRRKGLSSGKSGAGEPGIRAVTHNSGSTYAETLARCPGLVAASSGNSGGFSV